MTVLPRGKAGSLPETGLPIHERHYYQEIINDNIPFIERQCHRVCGLYKKKTPSISPFRDDSSDITAQSMHVSSIDEIDADTLFNEVLDRLTSNSYKVLREFENRSKLTTFLTTVITHLIIDIKRKNEGRNRAKDRAKAMGPVGEKLYDLVLIKGYPVEEAFDFVNRTDGITETLEEIETMVEKIRGRQTSHPQPGTGVEKRTPEVNLGKKQRTELNKKVLNEVLSELNNEERFIIRMRFPLSDDEEPKNLSEIAKILRITEKAVDSRIRRVLTKFKEKMLKYGLSIEDFVDA
jgi:RNA polymerase sigma factor (sigma-70 family)